MTDPQRSGPAHVPHEESAADRESRIETLLLTGLDHYFAAQYDRAISVWSRVLFLDRNHTRARAYIERARSALAERQRESEELVHRGVAAFEHGQIDLARTLLGAAIELGGAPDVALSYLDRLARLEPPPAASDGSAGPQAAHRPVTPRRVLRGRTARRAWLVPLLIAGVVIWAGIALVTSWDQVEPVLFLRSVADPDRSVARPATEEPLVVPRAGEMAVARAQALFAAGYLREALRLVEAVQPADPARPSADRLRAEIQQALFSGAGRAETPPAAAPHKGSDRQEREQPR